MYKLPDEIWRHIMIMAKELVAIQLSATCVTMKDLYKSLPKRKGSSIRDLIVSRIEFSNSNLYQLSKYGDEALLKPFLKRGFSWDHILLGASRAGHYDLASKAIRNGATSIQNAFIKARRNGFKSIEQLLGMRVYDKVCFAAGYRDVLAHIMRYSANARFSFKKICPIADIRTFKLIYAYGVTAQKEDMFYYLARYHRNDIIDWLRNLGELITDGGISGACKGANMKIILEYISNGGKLTSKHYAKICSGSNSKLMRWFYDNSYPTEKILEILVIKGRFGMIRWLLNKYKYDPMLFHSSLRLACKYGREKIAKLLLDNGAVWYDSFYKDACVSGNASLMAYLLPMSGDYLTEGFLEAVRKGNYQGSLLLINYAQCDMGLALRIASKKSRDNIIKMLANRLNS